MAADTAADRPLRRVVCAVCSRNTPFNSRSEASL